MSAEQQSTENDACPDCGTTTCGLADLYAVGDRWWVGNDCADPFDAPTPPAATDGEVTR